MRRARRRVTMSCDRADSGSAHKAGHHACGLRIKGIQPLRTTVIDPMTSPKANQAGSRDPGMIFPFIRIDSGQRARCLRMEVTIGFSAQGLSRSIAAVGLCAAIGVTALIPAPARARVFVGVGIGVPYYGYGPAYLPPPVYYPPPPVYYAPPPVYYAPPRVYAPPPPPITGRQACYAGQYVCPMDNPIAPGAGCYCSGNAGQRVWGRAS